MHCLRALGQLNRAVALVSHETICYHLHKACVEARRPKAYKLLCGKTREGHTRVRVMAEESDGLPKKRKKPHRLPAPASANPFAALVRSRPDPREADIAPAPTATPPPPPAEPAPNSEPRKYRAGLAAEIAKKRAIGVAGVTGGSQKKLKKLLKKKRAAGLA